jgi:hypothetical protein
MQNFDETLQGMLRAAQVARAKQDGVAVGEYRCECGNVRRWDNPEKCPVCPEKKHDSISLEEKQRSLAPVIRTIPSAMSWCRIGNSKWEEKCPRKGNAFARGWQRVSGSAVLWGQTGTGKTITAVALMHRLIDHVLRNDVDRSLLRFVAGMRFVSALDLALDRRKHPLGKAEAPLIETAKRASLLVLDEVGYEIFDPSKDTALFEIANERYGKENKPTIMTTGLDFRLHAPNGDTPKGEKWERFVDRYGEALWRRFYEPNGVEYELVRPGGAEPRKTGG